MLHRPLAIPSLSRRAFLGGLVGGLALPGAVRVAGAVTPIEIFADPDVPVLGNPRGDVAIAMWFDYQCPFCKKVEPEMMRVVREDGRVAVLLKDWPIFGKLSVAAARAAWSSRRQKRLEQVHAGLMAIDGRPTDDRVEAVLKAAGVDRKRLDADIAADGERFDELVARNGAQADGFGFGGTPAFVIGSFVFGGVLDADGFRQAIADARGKSGARPAK
jgi:protein-disulfide isomerase